MVLRLILDSLRYWVTEMHVDGFRFDLMSALTRTGHDVDMAGHAAHHDRPGPGAAAREAGRGAVGRLDGRLPGGRVPAAVGGVERPVPRHDARLLALAVRRRAQRRDPARGVLRPLPRRRAVAVRLDQLHHRARRLHAARPGVLRREAQRGQRRGQPGRHRQQPLVELRRRGRDRRRGGARAAPPSGRQPDRDALPVRRGADDHRRRRARPHPARQQQPLLAGQRDLLGRLVGRRRVARHLRDHPHRAADPARPPGAAAAALVRGASDDRRRPEGPRLGPPRGTRDDR